MYSPRRLATSSENALPFEAVSECWFTLHPEACCVSCRYAHSFGNTVSTLLESRARVEIADADPPEIRMPKYATLDGFPFLTPISVRFFILVALESTWQSRKYPEEVRR